jgi:hypothetical protein
MVIDAQLAMETAQGLNKKSPSSGRGAQVVPVIPAPFSARAALLVAEGDVP